MSIGVDDPVFAESSPSWAFVYLNRFSMANSPTSSHFTGGCVGEAERSI